MSRLSLILLVLLCGVSLAAPLTVQRTGNVITLRHQGEQLVLRRDMKIAYQDPYAPVKLAGGYTLLPPSKETIIEPGLKPNLLIVQQHGKTVATIDIDRQLETWVKAGVDWGGKDENDRVRGTREQTGRMPALFNITPVGDGALAILNIYDVRMSEDPMLAQMLVRIRITPRPAVEVVRPLSGYPLLHFYSPRPRLFRYYNQLFLYTEYEDLTKTAHLQQLNAGGTIGAKRITLPAKYRLIGIANGRRLVIANMHDVAVFDHTTQKLTRLPGPWDKPHKVERVFVSATGTYLSMRIAFPAVAERTKQYALPLPGNTDPLPYIANYTYLWHGFSIQAEASRLKVYDLATGRLLATHRL